MKLLVNCARGKKEKFTVKKPEIQKILKKYRGLPVSLYITEEDHKKMKTYITNCVRFRGYRYEDWNGAKILWEDQA